MSAVPYTATAVLLTVSIRHRAVPYLSRIHGFESPQRYGIHYGRYTGQDGCTGQGNIEKAYFFTDLATNK